MRKSSGLLGFETFYLQWKGLARRWVMEQRGTSKDYVSSSTDGLLIIRNSFILMVQFSEHSRLILYSPPLRCLNLGLSEWVIWVKRGSWIRSLWRPLQLCSRKEGSSAPVRLEMEWRGKKCQMRLRCKSRQVCLAQPQQSRFQAGHGSRPPGTTRGWIHGLRPPGLRECSCTDQALRGGNRMELAERASPSSSGPEWICREEVSTALRGLPAQCLKKSPPSPLWVLRIQGTQSALSVPRREAQECWIGSLPAGGWPSSWASEGVEGLVSKDAIREVNMGCSGCVCVGGGTKRRAWWGQSAKRGSRSQWKHLDLLVKVLLSWQCVLTQSP